MTMKDKIKNKNCKLPIVKIGKAYAIDGSKIFEEEMKDPEFRRHYEIEKKKLEMAMKIAELRKSKKLSQKQLAEKIGIKQSVIGRIEAGNQNLTIETLHKIAVALNKNLVVNFR